MPNGQYFLNDMEFERSINQMSDRDLLEFTARRTYEVCLLAAENKKRIEKVEASRLKTNGITGGVAGGIAAGIISAVNYFLGK